MKHNLEKQLIIKRNRRVIEIEWMQKGGREWETQDREVDSMFLQ